MHQNRRILLQKKLSIAKAPIFVSVSNDLVLTQSVGRIWDQGLFSTLDLTQLLLSLKLGVAINTLTLSQVLAVLRENPTEQTLVLSDLAASNVDYNRSLVNTLSCTQTVTAFISNRFVGDCEDSTDPFTLEEI